MQNDRGDAWMPPLTVWGELWRFAVCLLISVLAWLQLAEAQWQHARPLFWVDLGIGLASFPLVLLRRRYPLPIALLLTAFGAVSASSAGPSVLVTVSLCTRRRIPQIVLVGALSLAAAWASSVLQPKADQGPLWLQIGFALVVTVVILLGGMYLGSRRELVWSLRERAEVAERQQELRVEQARARERERIAREMHDVLAHRISLITMHAGALSYRSDLPRERVAETAELIASTSHEALAELREVLGVLRQTESVRPQPTLDALDELVLEAIESGTEVRVERDLDGNPVPDRLGRTAYRMIQEALTNARKHAPGAPVAISLRGNAGAGLTVSVRNARSRLLVPGARAGAGIGAGLGLVGMRERFELSGGHLDVDDGPRWFVVQGWLPWPR